MQRAAGRCPSPPDTRQRSPHAGRRSTARGSTGAQRSRPERPGPTPAREGLAVLWPARPPGRSGSAPPYPAERQPPPGGEGRRTTSAGGSRPHGAVRRQAPGRPRPWSSLLERFLRLRVEEMEPAHVDPQLDLVSHEDLEVGIDPRDQIIGADLAIQVLV